MKNVIWIYLYVVVLVLHLLSLLGNWSLVGVFSKSLLLPLLIIYCYRQTLFSDGLFKAWVFLALLFSWFGDVLLLFDTGTGPYFLLGLSSFLLAHLFYIFSLHGLRVREKIGSRIWIMIPVLVYYALFMWFLNPYLEAMKLPVRIYGVVLSFMLLMALHMGYLKEKRIGRLLVAGALLFVVSDSLLAINRFYRPIPLGAVWIMLTYGCAQLLLVAGLAGYIRAQVQ